MSKEPIGVLIMAYGGPDSLDEIPGYLADIRSGRPTTPAVLEEITHNYRQIGGRSPLMELTQQQMTAIRSYLDPGTFQLYLGMRHWAPWIEETIRDMLDDGITRAVSMVLAPHFSKLSIAKYQKKIAAGLEMYRGHIEFANIDSYHELLPGGVDSPVRAFKAVGGQPLFIEKGEGAVMTDVDGNRYIDYVLSWGPLILGHAHPRVVKALQTAVTRGTSYGAPSPLENELAKQVMASCPTFEMIRFVNSGTEATMSALRLARAYTGRSKIIKFQGNYHGHADMLLVQAGSGVATLGLPDSPGVPPAATADTLVAPLQRLNGR
jgi:hypothetical protein